MKAYKNLTARGQVRRIRPLAKALLDFHDQPFDKLALIHHGENTTFRAKHAEKNFLCRIHRPGYQSLESIRSEMIILDHFRANGIRVPEPVYKNKEAVHRFSGKEVEARYGVLFRWLPGRFQVNLSVNTAQKIGRFMAKMHVVAGDFISPKEFYRPRLDANHIFTGLGGSLKDHPESAQKLILRVKNKLETSAAILGTASDVFGIIHADFHAGNRLLDQGEVVAIDFDDAAWSWFIHDIAVCMSYHNGQKNYSAVLASFLAGYREIKPLSAVEENALPLFTAVRNIQILMWVGGRKDNPSFVARYPKILSQIEKGLQNFLA